MKKLLNLLGIIILSQTTSLIVYILLWLNLFSLIFTDTLQFFNLSGQINFIPWIPAIWIILMCQKMDEKSIFYQSVNIFKHRETQDGDIYSFPGTLKFVDGTTKYADGTITINNTKFKKFSYKNTIRGLEFHRESDLVSGILNVRLHIYGIPVKEDLIKGPDGWDVLIGIFGILILSNYLSWGESNGFMIGVGAVISGAFGFIIYYIFSIFFPFMRAGIRVRIFNKLKKLPDNKIDKKIKEVLSAILMDKKRDSI